MDAKQHSRVDDLTLVREQLSSPFRDGWREAADALDRIEEQLQAAEAGRAGARLAADDCREHFMRLEEQLEAAQKALAEAVDVAIWLTGLPCLNPESEAWAYWESGARPKLYKAMTLLDAECDGSANCRAAVHILGCFAGPPESSPARMSERSSEDAPGRAGETEPSHGREASRGAKQFDSAHVSPAPSPASEPKA